MTSESLSIDATPASQPWVEIYGSRGLTDWMLAHCTSNLSALNFRVDGLEFVSSVVDFHPPVDAALSVVDVR